MSKLDDLDKEFPKCRDCGQDMFEIGGTGKSVQIVDLVGGYNEVVGVREQKIYQCPEDKTIAID